MNYKIIKKLGYGRKGTVFLVKKDNKEYALKIEHIFEEDIKKNRSSQTWREINFAKKMYKLNPTHFMKLIDYDFIDNCTYTQINPHKDVIIKGTYYDKLYSSTFCSRKMYSLIDTTFKEALPKMSDKQIYSALIQLFYIVELIHKNNFVHGDLKGGNVGVIYTNKKYIKIYGKNVPTNGIIVQLLDYGSVLNKDDIVNDYEKQKFEAKMILEERYDIVKLFTIISKVDHNINRSSSEYREILNLTEQSTFTQSKYPQEFLYKILYPSKYFKTDEEHPKIYLKIPEILYIMKSKDSIKKLIQHYLPYTE